MTLSAWALALVVVLMPDATTGHQDVFTLLEPGSVQFEGGLLGERYGVNRENRLAHVDEDELLDCFEHRESPHQDWQGEHVGKFLHAATLTWATTGDRELREKTGRTVDRLLKTQEADGYLGTYRSEERWTKWDVWVHKYNLIGLLTYAKYAQDGRAATAAKRIGDLLVRTFGVRPGQRDINKAGEHVGMAATSVLEPMVCLYRATGDHRYLDFAKYIVSNYDAVGGPAILSSLERHESVRKVANAKAYEMTSNFVGLLELYRATGDERLLNDVLTAWADITSHRLYVTGTGSNRELWTEDHSLPNDASVNPNETCVTVTWEQLNLQLLRLKGESRFADRIEQTVYNHLLGAQRPDGGAWAYYSALKGRKPYGSTTNCCVSSGPRGIAMIPLAAVTKSPGGGLAVHLYTAAKVSAVAKGTTVKLQIATSLPASGRVDVRVDPATDGHKFPLWFRVPSWSPAVKVELDGRPIAVEPNGQGYVVIERAWKKGAHVTLNLDTNPTVVEGKDGNAGQVHVRYGPCVMALDTVLNPDLGEPSDWALVPGSVRVPTPEKGSTTGMFGLSAEVEGPGGQRRTVRLTPFAFAGRDGQSDYTVWLKKADARY